MHQADLRPVFYRKWAGTTGRFQREIKKLERNFNRKCGRKYPNRIPSRSSMAKSNRSKRSENFQNEVVEDFPLDSRERRSGDQLRVAHNPGHRMRHIVRNIEQWTGDYLTECSNQRTVTYRWQRFVRRWEDEIQKNPIFQEEFKKEERYLRNNAGPNRPCGRIYREFGLHGQYMELQDASSDENYGFDDLRWTVFGNDHLMSMVPFEGTSSI